ncbi:NAD(P)H-dependent oxidoreductase subunit E [Cryptosporangium arvum]|uniref:NADH:ubiquinone oxidoreductase 24 kD subunit n=1 Tax=Cryptosporangium arvum DSM 44712 TaxID=927661 RepID=A0A010ZWE6_9ACTN|nr:NAD(P)H-dependent oxidoreductase subunit E [Cryptosporangium arvum]EXG81542.1 NADH:ubiquinone oxidoreductase 24 kD subunit [Cryptosporangium arvum DSM 44712]
MTRTDESRAALEPPALRRRRRTEPANPLAGLDPQLVLTVRRVVEAHRDWRGPLLPVLHALQDELGYLPADATPILAHELNLSRAEVHGVITFYTDFRSEPGPTRTVRICRAEACQAVGAESLVEAAGGRAEQVFCLGNCALGPSVEVDGRVLGRVTPEKLREVLS